MNKLREAEILLNRGASIAEASKEIGVSEQTYYLWGKEYVGVIEQAKRLKELKRRMPISRSWTDLSLDNSMCDIWCAILTRLDESFYLNRQ